MENKLLHTFLAGWCAEAAGARLEFKKCRYTEQHAIQAMHFQGGKTNQINEGQYTDDTEMEIALLRGILKGLSKDNEYFPATHVADEYIHWYKSNPFDMGQTTSYALCGAKTENHLYRNASLYNEHSESNGSLMRCVPIACLGIPFFAEEYNLSSFESIKELAAIDASMTHPSPVVHESTGIYCCILAVLMSPNTKMGLFEKVPFLLSSIHSAHPTVQNWIDEALSMETLDEYNCITSEGHVKHAFLFVIFFLKHYAEYTYEQAISKVLQLGGDTDTNAKIVGNLFGAMYGDCVPQYMKDVVLSFDSSKSPIDFFQRPEIYNVQHAVQYVHELSQYC